MIEGIKKTVMTKDGRTRTGCFGCRNCIDTGYSWVCEATDEKLEGFDSMEDKINKNKETFLSKNILIGVGCKCPLTVVTDKKTPIKYTVPLTKIAEFVDDETLYVYSNDDDIDEGKLIIGVQWIEGGYPDDDAHRDWVQDELSEVVRKIEKKFNVKVEDGDCDLEYEEVIISL